MTIPEKPLFDSWTDRYDRWFDTPQGRLIRRIESGLLLDLLRPGPGESILDAGCGTGIFTLDVLETGAAVTGMDLSGPMLQKAVERTAGRPFEGLLGDLCALPFRDESFDRVFSMTAIEFVPEADRAVAELNRVTRPGGCVVVTTLNRLSPWADRRREKADLGHSLFRSVIFRSPDEMRALVPAEAVVKTAIHFLKQDPVDEAPAIERSGREREPENGAFLAVQWTKP